MSKRLFALSPLKSGFTLAELLISLAILGVIATFTIPKLLQVQQNQQYNSIAKETEGTISNAFSKHQLSGQVSANTKAPDLLQYMNYMKYDTVSVIDGEYGGGTLNCSAAWPCIKLANGAMLLAEAATFGGSATTNLIWFDLDPDGKVTDGTTNGPGKSLNIVVYYNGIIRTNATLFPNSCDGVPSCWNPDPTQDPPWFIGN